MDTEGNDRPHYFKLTQKALNLRYEFESDVEVELGPGGRFEHMTDWAGKLTGQATRLAGLIHCTKHERPHEHPIDAETMESALYLAAVLTEHVKAALDLMNETPGMDCARTIWCWLERESMKEFTQRETLEKVKGRFRTAKEVEGGLEILKDYGLIVEQEKKATRGRPSRVFLVNPLARSK